MFNQLEQQVLAWYQARFTGTALDRQIGSVKLVRREWTRVGFYTELEVSRDVDTHAGTFPVGGPNIRSTGIDLGGGCLLWGENGFVNCLELYANGNYFDKEIREFELLDP